MLAFYFSATNKRLRYSDNRKIKTGKTHKVSGKIEPCFNGLHASTRLMDALNYAPGGYLWIVKLGGDIVENHNKCTASERTYLAGFNAEKMLREFARRQALINIEKIKPYCTKPEYKLILEWIETGKEDLRSAADSAAYFAACSAACSTEVL